MYAGRRAPNFVDRTGMRYGRLTVVSLVSPSGKRANWLCRCDCGTEKIVLSDNLVAKRTLSCGCLNAQRRAETGAKRKASAAPPEVARARRLASKAIWNAKPIALDKKREWAASNKEAVRSKNAAYTRNNKDLVNARTAARRAARARATPAWANADDIRQIYEIAAVLSRSGVKFHVDHEVPLRGKTVCGLHVETNLRVIPAYLNIAKHNRFWPGMP